MYRHKRVPNGVHIRGDLRCMHTSKRGLNGVEGGVVKLGVESIEK